MKTVILEGRRLIPIISSIDGDDLRTIRTRGKFGKSATELLQKSYKIRASFEKRVGGNLAIQPLPAVERMVERTMGCDSRPRARAKPLAGR